MSTSRQLLLVALCLLLGGSAVDADPPKGDKPVPPLADLIKVLKDGTREEQVSAAEVIRDHYEGKCLDALPQMVASLGRELARPYKAPDPGLPVMAKLQEAAQRAGPKRFKQLLEMTADKEPEVRAAAFRLLFSGSDYYQKWTYKSEEKSGLDPAEVLKVGKVGVADKSPLVRTEALYAMAALSDSDDSLSVPAVELLAKALDDREQIPNKRPYQTPASAAAGALHHFRGKAKPAFEALLKAAESDDEYLAGECSRVVGRLAKSDEKMAAIALKLFRKQITDPKASERVCINAMVGLVELGKSAEPAVTEIAALLDRPKRSVEFWSRVYEALYAFGPASAPAVPTLLAQLDKTTDRREQGSIFSTLAAIGPAARDAAKAIETWAERNPEMNGSVRMRMTEALDKIK